MTRQVQRSHTGSPSGVQNQAGVITLLVAFSLGLLASLASAYSARSVWMDRLASHNQVQAAQARLAAEAALAWARAELQRQYANSPAPTLWTDAQLSSPCPAAYTGPNWQCVTLPPPAHPDLPDAGAQVLVVRDLIGSPHVAQLLANVRLKHDASPVQVRAQVFIPTVAPALDPPNTAAVVLQGCAAAASPAARSVCPGNPNACKATAWGSVLGAITPEQIRVWSEAQERQGLDALSQPKRSVYWVDSPSAWTQSLGSIEAPVLLVFSAQACTPRCPALAPGVRVVGTVVLQSQCQDEKTRAWHAGHIQGQLVVESGLPELQSGSLIEAQDLAQAPYRLPWPAGMQAQAVLRVPGSWSETGP